MAPNRFTVEVERRERRDPKVGIENATLAVPDDVHWAGYGVRGDRRPARHGLDQH